MSRFNKFAEDSDDISKMKQFLDLDIQELADGVVAYYSSMKRNIENDLTGDRVLERGLENEYEKLDAASRKLGKPLSLLVEELDSALKITLDEDRLRDLVMRTYRKS